MNDEQRIYTLKEIADELKIDKQRVYRFVKQNHISEVHHEVLHDVLLKQCETLAIYAVKCGISEDELRRDAYRLLKVFDDLSVEQTNRFTEDDVISALEMYNESFVTFPRDDIEKYSGIPIPANKRNGKRREQHLEVARAVRDVKSEQRGKENWWQGNGRPSKETAVREYMLAHPDVETQADIAKALKIDRHTVSKYYKQIRAELSGGTARRETAPRVAIENGRIVLKGVSARGGRNMDIREFGKLREGHDYE